MRMNISDSLVGSSSRRNHRMMAEHNNLELSSEKYNVVRKNFNHLQNEDLKYFANVLGKDCVLTENNDVAPYNIDWFKTCKGQSQVVLKPKSSEEVSKILAYCNERKLPVCPQGGNTGVVGGSVPVYDEIVISLSSMNKIISVDELSGVLVCEAGCVLEDLDNFAQKHNLAMPLDMGAKKTCQIGGNVSTNAGGLRLLRFGNLHGNVLGLEVVRADGTILNCLNTLKKDNTGYHLKHLFIGSEGTLGIVTKVAISCPPLSKALHVGFFGVKSFEDVLRVYKSAKSELGEILSAFEMAEDTAVRTAVINLKLSIPIGDYPFYIIVETRGSNVNHDSEKINNFLKKEMNSGLIQDGIVAYEPEKFRAIWKIREGIPIGAIQEGYGFHYDVSIPLKDYYSIVPILKERLGKKAKSVLAFGHIGDSNLHIIVVVHDYSAEVKSLLEPFIYEEVSRLKGSVSAEHGIGFLKSKYLHLSKDNSAISLMKDLKNLMDPNGILNPYKVLPDGQ